MLTAMSAMNKRIKAVFQQVNSGEDYNAAIDRQFTMQVDLDEVAVAHEPEEFDGSDGDEETDVACGPSNA